MSSVEIVSYLLILVDLDNCAVTMAKSAVDFVSEMIYYVSSGTLNPTQPLTLLLGGYMYRVGQKSRLLPIYR